MKTSARNQFLGKVTRIKTGAVNDEIELEIAGGQKITAIITHESTEELGLQTGSEAFALIKSSSIILMADHAGVKLSARNQLSGSVTRILPGAVNTEVVLEMPGGATMAAIITNESCASMGLVIGAALTGLFKASSVILGVAA